MGPRFLTTMLPFLAVPLGIAFKRYPGPTIALAAVSITTTVIATITHPLVGYENETVVWVRYLDKGLFQPTIASAYGLGRGWGGIWPFFLAAGAAVGAAAWATPRLRLSPATLRWSVLAVVGWALFAALAPTLLGIDHAGLTSIYRAGDHTAFNLKLHSGSRYPLKTLALLAALAGLLALVAAWLGGELGRHTDHSSAPADSSSPGSPRSAGSAMMRMSTPGSPRSRRIGSARSEAPAPNRRRPLGAEGAPSST
jgi:hypothetical protein